MTISTICRKVLTLAAVAIFWLGVWQLAALSVGIELLVPTPITVIKTLISKFGEKSFIESVLYSLFRVLAGFVLSVSVGAVLGVITARSRLANTFISPLLLVLRAAPVASFAILVLLWIKSNDLPIFISFVTGVPIVWRAVHDAVNSQDKKLLEAAKVFGFGRIKTFVYVTLPCILPVFISSAVTTLGFCWKSGVAAEIICLPAKSIGKGLNSAKLYLETAEVFAYTLVTVLLSIIFEFILKTAVKKLLRERQVQNGVGNTE